MTHVLVMGVCGTGKSSVGSAIAERLGADFLDADGFHPPANIDSMRAGRPLDDDMRRGWLDAVGEAVAGANGRQIFACSALKSSYRDRLRARIGDMLTVHLTGTQSLLENRVRAREGHFMPASLVASQFADLEPPSGQTVVEIDVAHSPDEVVNQAVSFIRDADRRLCVQV